MSANICRRFFGTRWALAVALILAIGAASIMPASAQYYYERPGHWWWNGRAYVWVYDPPPPPVIYAPPPPTYYYGSPVYAYPSFSFVFGGRGHDGHHHH